MIYSSFKLPWALFFFLLVTLFKRNNVLSKRKRKTFVKNVKWYPQRIKHYYINHVVFPSNKRRIATFFVCLGSHGKKKNKTNYKFNIKSKLNVEGDNKKGDHQKNEDDHQKNEDDHQKNEDDHQKNGDDHQKNGDDHKKNEYNNKTYNTEPIDDKNQFISRTFEGINIFPIKQNEKDQDYLKTKLPAREFKPKRSLGQNYLKDTNIIKKMISAIEYNVEHHLFQNKKRMNVRKEEDKKK
ncbi:apicoplast dimethyladenosine synthase, putative, partial [Plasmodium reichenowi]